MESNSKETVIIEQSTLISTIIDNNLLLDLLKTTNISLADLLNLLCTHDIIVRTTITDDICVEAKT